MKQEELAIIKQAIVNEVEGYEFYNMAAKQVSNEAQASFIQLANEELEHVKWLEKFYKNVAEDTSNINIAFDVELPSPALYRWENIDRKKASLAVSVFGIGIQMEKAAVIFYTNAAEKTQIPKLKELYQKLILWEQSHLEQFSGEYDRLKDEWWDDQDFAPM